MTTPSHPENPSPSSPSVPEWKQPASPGNPSASEQSGSQRSTHSPALSSPTATPASQTSAPLLNTPNGLFQLEMWTSSSAEPHANPTALPASGSASMTPADSLCSPFLDWLIASNPGISYGRTFQASSRLVTREDLISPNSSLDWGTSGMGSPTGCLTLKASESVGCTHIDAAGQRCRNADAESLSSLAEILEVGEIAQRFYLSPKAAAGILRRSQRRGKTLPPMLEKALRQTCSGQEAISPTQSD